MINHTGHSNEIIASMNKIEDAKNVDGDRVVFVSSTHLPGNRKLTDRDWDHLNRNSTKQRQGGSFIGGVWLDVKIQCGTCDR